MSRATQQQQDRQFVDLITEAGYEGRVRLTATLNRGSNTWHINGFKMLTAVAEAVQVEPHSCLFAQDGEQARAASVC